MAWVLTEWSGRSPGWTLYFLLVVMEKTVSKGDPMSLEEVDERIDGVFRMFSSCAEQDNVDVELRKCARSSRGFLEV
jgi:hypothetical protein